MFPAEPFLKCSLNVAYLFRLHLSTTPQNDRFSSLQPKCIAKKMLKLSSASTLKLFRHFLACQVINCKKNHQCNSLRFRALHTEGFKKGDFSLKIHQIFSVYTMSAKFKNAKLSRSRDVRFVFRENSGQGNYVIIVTSSFLKSSVYMQLSGSRGKQTFFVLCCYYCLIPWIKTLENMISVSGNAS